MKSLLLPAAEASWHRLKQKKKRSICFSLSLTFLEWVSPYRVPNP